MLTYELILTYNDGETKKERATLPAIMGALAIYMDDETWTYAKITNCATGEVIAEWEYYRYTWGATRADA